ncbi:FtsZ-interacting cell division protein ZipA [Pseudonocardia eucalypti]|nr:FtsZ-interacting cell division protein ZipA [Pseudonocardia eucalypti]
MRAYRMADLAYLLLIVGGFAVLALLLRGLEQL